MSCYPKTKGIFSPYTKKETLTKVLPIDRRQSRGSIRMHSMMVVPGLCSSFRLSQSEGSIRTDYSLSLECVQGFIQRESFWVGGGGSSRKLVWLYILFYTTVPNFGGEASPHPPPPRMKTLVCVCVCASPCSKQKGGSGHSGRANECVELQNTHNC